jgi:hypothetical protein
MGVTFEEEGTYHINPISLQNMYVAKISKTEVKKMDEIYLPKLPYPKFRFVDTGEIITDDITIFEVDNRDEWSIMLDRNDPMKRLKIAVPTCVKKANATIVAFVNNLLPTNVGDTTTLSNSKQSCFYDLIKGNLLTLETSYVINIDKERAYIPAQLQKENDMYVIRGQYIDANNRVYIVEVRQTEDLDSGDSLVAVTKKITRIS